MGKNIVVSKTVYPFKYKRSRVSGNIIEVRKYEKMNTEMPITKIDKERYIVNSTGEIKLYQKRDKRSDNLSGLAKSMSDVRSILNENFSGATSEVWLTLTYGDNMTDPQRLTKDHIRFFQRVKRAYPEIPLEYVMIVEPQARGAWHTHELWKRTDGLVLYIPQKELLQMWRQTTGCGGTVTVKRLDKSDNIGAYLTAYLSNMPVVGSDTDSKAFIKGSRLHLYPARMRFYRASKGIKIPEWDTGQKKNADISARTPIYRKIVEINDDAGKHVQTIEYLQYNTKRH